MWTYLGTIIQPTTISLRFLFKLTLSFTHALTPPPPFTLQELVGDSQPVRQGKLVC